MICWITSYPRSGNTLTRQILRDSFGIETYTAYVTDSLDGQFQNQRKYDFSDKEVYRALTNSEEVYFVKTHNITFDPNPFIHIVRNGRDACGSLARMWDITNLETVSGCHEFPDWSSHYWGYHGRSNGITLKFEDLLSKTDLCVDAIGKFVKQQPKPFINKFNPKDNIDGDGGKIKAVFTREEELLFRRNHGVVMGVLGYD
jgi:hypothetical protein